MCRRQSTTISGKCCSHSTQWQEDARPGSNQSWSVHHAKARNASPEQITFCRLLCTPRILRDPDCLGWRAAFGAHEAFTVWNQRKCLEYPTVWRLFGVSTGIHCYIQLGIQTPPATRGLRNVYFGPADPEASKLRSNTIAMYLGAAQCTPISSWLSPSVIASTDNATVQHRGARLRALFIQCPRCF